MNKHTEIDKLFTKCFEKIKGSKTPRDRLIPVLQNMYTKYSTDKTLSEADIEFLTEFLNTPKKQLLDKAYIDGVFYTYKSHTHKTINLKSKKNIKKVFFSRYE